MATEIQGAVLRRVLAAEALKLKHTLALWMCVIAPAVVVLLQVLQLLLHRGSAEAVAGDPWMGFGRAILALWSFLMLPLFVTLQAALLAALEHQERHWKHLLALPVPRGAHYLAKAAMLAALLALATLLLVGVLIPLCGQLLRLRPAMGMNGWPDLATLGTLAAQVYAASLLMLALQIWVALRWRSFTVAVATGMSATVMGFLIGQSATWGPWFPWTMAVQPMTRNPSPGTVVLVSTLGAVLVTAIGARAFARREDAG